MYEMIKKLKQDAYKMIEINKEVYREKKVRQRLMTLSDSGHARVSKRRTRKLEDLFNRGMQLQDSEGDGEKRWVDRYSPSSYIDRRKLL